MTQFQMKAKFFLIFFFCAASLVFAYNYRDKVSTLKSSKIPFVNNNEDNKMSTLRSSKIPFVNNNEDNKGVTAQSGIISSVNNKKYIKGITAQLAPMPFVNDKKYLKGIFAQVAPMPYVNDKKYLKGFTKQLAPMPYVNDKKYLKGFTKQLAPRPYVNDKKYHKTHPLKSVINPSVRDNKDTSYDKNSCSMTLANDWPLEGTVKITGTSWGDNEPLVVFINHREDWPAFIFGAAREINEGKYNCSITVQRPSRVQNNFVECPFISNKNPFVIVMVRKKTGFQLDAYAGKNNTNNCDWNYVSYPPTQTLVEGNFTNIALPPHIHPQGVRRYISENMDVSATYDC